MSRLVAKERANLDNILMDGARNNDIGLGQSISKIADFSNKI
jgi:hypothetical protein